MFQTMDVHRFRKWDEKPIPKLTGIEGYESIPIYECGEELLSLNGPIDKTLFTSPVYYLSGYMSATNLCSARKVS